MMKVKGRYFLLILLISLAFWALAPPAPAAEKGLPVVFAFDEDDPPFTFMERGAASGYSVELLAAALKNFPVQIRHLPLQWEAVQKQLADGTVQVTTNMAQTPERLKIYAFSAQPVSDLKVTLFTTARTGIKTLKDLSGRRVASQKGSLYANLLIQKGFKPMLYETESAALAALAKGDVDAAVISKKSALYAIKKQGLKGVFPVSTPLYLSATYFAVKKDNTQLLAMIDEGMSRVKRDGTFDRIYRKWFVEELTLAEVETLKKEAREAAFFAYAPYSNFSVGAAVLTASGKIYTGCNIENALLGYTQSALKVAIGKAVSAGEYHFRAVINVMPGDRLGAPAADERQMLHEFGADTLVVLEKSPGSYETVMASELLPYPFQMP